MARINLTVKVDLDQLAADLVDGFSGDKLVDFVARLDEIIADPDFTEKLREAIAEPDPVTYRYFRLHNILFWRVADGSDRDDRAESINANFPGEGWAPSVFTYGYLADNPSTLTEVSEEDVPESIGGRKKASREFRFFKGNSGWFWKMPTDGKTEGFVWSPKKGDWSESACDIRGFERHHEVSADEVPPGHEELGA